MNQTYDYILVGQGLAGTLLGWFLEKNGCSILVIDKHDASSSSHIAAGIIHPITGRRLVKSWRADELIPFAEKTYQDIGERFGTHFYQKQTILEYFSSVKHRNDWLTRSTENDLKDYCGQEIAADHLPGLNLAFGGICINKGGYLKISHLISRYRSHLIETGACLDDTFRYEDIIRTKPVVEWKSVTARAIIFCEGHLARLNPYFSSLPFVPAKGEILTIESKELPETFILNRSLYLLPVGNHQFRAGATHEWDQINCMPTETAKQKIIRLLDEMISVPYNITGHFAAVRPTVKDRRPFLGRLPDEPNLYILNGLGTKGVMLAPWFAYQLAETLFKNIAIDREADICRFL